MMGTGPERPARRGIARGPKALYAKPHGSACLRRLFVAAFVAATLLPAQSELLLAGLLAGDGLCVPLLIAAATAGNVLGSTVNWLLGRCFHRYRNRRWFPITEASLAGAERRYRRYGRWTLLLSWMPVVGDPLTLAAGLLKEPLPSFLLLVTAAKLGRYLVVAAAAFHWL